MAEISCLPIKIEFVPLIRLLLRKQKAVSFVLPFREAARKKMPFSSSAACRLALPAVSSMSAPDSVAPVTTGEIIFALRKKTRKKQTRKKPSGEGL